LPAALGLRRPWSCVRGWVLPLRMFSVGAGLRHGTQLPGGQRGRANHLLPAGRGQARRIFVWLGRALPGTAAVPGEPVPPGVHAGNAVSSRRDHRGHHDAARMPGVQRGRGTGRVWRALQPRGPGLHGVLQRVLSHGARRPRRHLRRSRAPPLRRPMHGGPRLRRCSQPPVVPRRAVPHGVQQRAGLCHGDLFRRHGGLWRLQRLPLTGWVRATSMRSP